MRKVLAENGADEVVIESQLIAEFGAIDASPIEVLQEHWRAFMLFDAVCNQFESNAMGGGLVRLRYEAVDVVIKYRPELTPSAEDFEKLQLIERVVINHVNEHLQNRDQSRRRHTES